jgi:glycyl-tRNA synthetase
MTEADIAYKIDDSGSSLGRRYARTDELGAAFAWYAMRCHPARARTLARHHPWRDAELGPVTQRDVAPLPCSTIDFETLQSDTVTIREKDSMEQIRLPLADAASVIKQLVRGRMAWADATAKYPKFVAQEA